MHLLEYIYNQIYRYPFSKAPDINRRRSRQRQPPRSRQRQTSQQSPGADVLAARASFIQGRRGSSVTPRLGLLPPSNPSNSLSQAGTPASTFALNSQTGNPVNEGFTLLAGLGTQPDPSSNQYQAGLQEPAGQNFNFGTPKTPVQPVFSNNIAPSQSSGFSPTNTSPFSGFPNFPTSSLQQPDNNNFQNLNPEINLQDFDQDIAAPAINVLNDPFLFPKANPTRQPATRPTPAFFVPSRQAPQTRRPSQAARQPIRNLTPTRRPAIRFQNPNRRRNPAQRRRNPSGQTFSAVAAAGQKCIDKIEEVEEIEYDEVVNANKYDNNDVKNDVF